MLISFLVMGNRPYIVIGPFPIPYTLRRVTGAKGYSRTEVSKPQDPRIPKRERIMIPTRGMAQHSIIRKE
jgi:hypothetical protein